MTIEDNSIEKYTMSTYTKKKFDYLNIESNEICIYDLISGLSNESRYAGQRDFLYVVGEHSLLVARAVFEIAERHLPDYIFEATFAGQFHDGSEAYCKDLPTPQKILLPDYMVMEKRVQDLIEQQLGVLWEVPENEKNTIRDLINYCDKLVYNLECEAFKREDEKDNLKSHITDRIASWDLSCSLTSDNVEGKHPQEVAIEFSAYYNYLQQQIINNYNMRNYLLVRP